MHITYLSSDQTLCKLNQDASLDIYLDQIEHCRRGNIPWQRGSIPWHWHAEIEFAVASRGATEFSIAEETVVLQEGEGLFINSSQLHCIRPLRGDTSSLFTVAVNPRLLSSGFDLLSTKYVLPHIGDTAVKYAKLSPPVAWQKQALSHLDHISSVSSKPSFGFEFDMRNALCHIWLLLLQNVFNASSPAPRSGADDDLRIKRALAFIHEHYADDISLSDISNAINLSKSECCRSFQRVLRTTPVDLLITYRLERAAALLSDTGLPVSTIATMSGFNSLSYFSKLFRERIGCSPREYRCSPK
ncbi:MAG: AraC family transcriptional regulator [Christensenella sp.]|uniref:AraC family transcriptional regulator n=1 Tax=Christensenella sp. TaxID=1935934 RepID=UPI002B1FF7D5|nr:AraC family transcriptional regulator [Christensenella sp.]MEA5001922.1 AraC family transcriptional regulator [Christensenella sp.]